MKIIKSLYTYPVFNDEENKIEIAAVPNKMEAELLRESIVQFLTKCVFTFRNTVGEQHYQILLNQTLLVPVQDILNEEVKLS